MFPLKLLLCIFVANVYTVCRGNENFPKDRELDRNISVYQALTGLGSYRQKSFLYQALTGLGSYRQKSFCKSGVNWIIKKNVVLKVGFNVTLKHKLTLILTKNMNSMD